VSRRSRSDRAGGVRKTILNNSPRNHFSAPLLAKYVKTMVTWLKIIIYTSSSKELVLMKKQELIHLHGLLAEVRKQCEFWDDDVDLEAYEELGVKPTSIHKSKTDHKAAVFKLTEGITEPMESSESEPLAPTAD